MTKPLERQKTVWQGLTCEYRKSNKPYNGVYIWFNGVRYRTHPKHGQTVLASVRAWLEEVNRGNVIHLPAGKASGYIPLWHNGQIYSYKVTAVSTSTKQVVIKRLGIKGRGRANEYLKRIVTNGDAVTAVTDWLDQSA